MGWPVAASHSRTVLSPPPEAMRWPSGLNATLDTAFWWPVIGWPTGWPVAASHTRTVLSKLPEAIRLPSGLNATLDTASGCAGDRLADGLAGGRVPHPHGVVAPPEAIRLPSGLNATLRTAVLVAGERLADGLAGVPRPTAARCCRDRRRRSGGRRG